jgi:hypothetical protein
MSSIVMSNPGMYNGASFLLVYDAVKHMIANGQANSVAQVSALHQTTTSIDAIVKTLKTYVNL